MRRKTSIAVLLVSVMGLALLVGLVGCGSSSTDKKLCFANMRDMDGAISGYEATKNAAPTSLNQLVQAQFLKKVPTCPSGGKYSIVAGPPTVTKCSIHGELK